MRMRPYHIFLTAHQCSRPTLTDEGLLESFIEKLAYATRTQVIHGPHTVKRKGIFSGITSSAITHTSHLAVHTFAQDRDVVVHILSYEALKSDHVRDAFISHFKHPMRHVKMKEVVSNPEPLECEEPGCSRPAAKEWKGRLMCHDHYDQYRESYDSVHSDDTVL